MVVVVVVVETREQGSAPCLQGKLPRLRQQQPHYRPSDDNEDTEDEEEQRAAAGSKPRYRPAAAKVTDARRQAVETLRLTAAAFDDQDGDPAGAAAAPARQPAWADSGRV